MYTGTSWGEVQVDGFFLMILNTLLETFSINLLNPFFLLGFFPIDLLLFTLSTLLLLIIGGFCGALYTKSAKKVFDNSYNRIAFS
jgi:uncharacterized membrane protein